MAETPWDPYTHQDPVHALTERLRAMPVGHHVQLSDGTVVKSVPMKWGATHVRRFAVTNPGENLPRGGSQTNSVATAEDAAKAALKRRST